MKHEIIFTPIKDLYELKGEKYSDNRGEFLNIFRIQEKEFKNIWRDRDIEQINISKNKKVGTIRGLHYQNQPYEEAKIIRCLKGKVWDVAVDLRKTSTTYGKWHSVVLDSTLDNSFFIPEGFAHGFQVLEANSELLYIHSSKWISSSEKGLRWNDKKLLIEWPLPCSEISIKDANLPELK